MAFLCLKKKGRYDLKFSVLILKALIVLLVCLNQFLKLRYVLKKSFAHGSYGKVLLAFNGNCQKVFSSVGENVYVSCNSYLEVFIARNYGLRLYCSS